MSPALLTANKRNDVRTLIGRKTATEIREWAGEDADRAWAYTVADRLVLTGFMTLADVTDDEFDEIIA